MRPTVLPSEHCMSQKYTSVAECERNNQVSSFYGPGISLLRKRTLFFAEVLPILAAHGANLDKPDMDGWTPAHVASSNGNGEVMFGEKTLVPDFSFCAFEVLVEKLNNFLIQRS